jgi:pikachurin
LSCFRYIHLRYNQAAAHIDIKYNGTKVIDNLWHRVRASRNNQKGSLRVDGGKAIMYRMRAKRKLFDASPGLYLGKL